MSQDLKIFLNYSNHNIKLMAKNMIVIWNNEIVFHKASKVMQTD